MGSSTYALSTMLAVFMSGLSLGGLLGARYAYRLKRPEFAFAFCELGIGITGLATIPAIKAFTPLYIASFYAFHLSFSAFSVVQFLIIFMIMGIPTTLMGLTFPIAIRFFTLKRQEASRQSGNLYFINTLGAIIGSISAGFLLIPLLGTKGAAITAATLNIGSAVVIILLSGRFGRAVNACLTLLILLPLTGFLYKPGIPFFSYYSAYRFGSYGEAAELIDEILSSEDHKIIYHNEGINGEVYLTSFKGYNLLFNNGKLELGDDEGFALLAYLPYMLLPDPELARSVLNIGLGSGHTLRHLSKLPVKRIDSVEINSDILEINRRFLNPGLFNDPGINHIEADGRNFLLLRPEKYDIIIASPSWAVEASSASLLTDEFYSLVRKRLHRAGVFATWLDYFLMSEKDLEIMLRTMRNNFANVTAWLMPGDNMVLTGSNLGISSQPESVMREINSVWPELKGKYRIAVSASAVRALPDGPVNTDIRPIIEFENARNIILGRRELYELKRARRGF